MAIGKFPALEQNWSDKVLRASVSLPQNLLETYVANNNIIYS